MGIYIKINPTVEAVQLEHPTTITTKNGVYKAAKGDYLVIDEQGEQYFMQQTTFEDLYNRDNAAGEITSVVSQFPDANTLKVNFVTPNEYDFEKVRVYKDTVLYKEIQLDNATAAVFIDEGLKGNTAYAYRFTTVTRGVFESTGVDLNVTTPVDTIPPANVTNIMALAVAATSVEFSFTLPSDKDFDRVNVYLDGVLFTTSRANGVILSGLNKNTTYAVTFKSVDTSGNESIGASTSVTTLDDVVAPAEIVGLTSSVGSATADFQWVNPLDTDFVSVRIYRDGALVATAPKPNTTYSASGLAPSTAYVFEFKTIDIVGNESAGTSVTVNTTA